MFGRNRFNGISGQRYGRKDGSGKGVGRPGGLRRNQNPTPCPLNKQNGYGRGGNRYNIGQVKTSKDNY